MLKFPALKPAVYVALIVLALTGTYFHKVRTTGIFACSSAGYGADGYLVYCDSPGYGDYDQGAMWFGLEPRARERVRDADVLFLGSSRLQFALSSDATRRWFEASGASHYLLGFSHTQNASFVQPLLARLQPRAKVYVINADRFFNDIEIALGTQILHEPGIRRRYEQKRLWQHVHRRACGWLSVACGDESYAYYRTPDNGHWTVRGGLWSNPGPPTDLPPEQAEDREHWERFAGVARQFVAALPVPRECVLLTMVPYPGTRISHAQAMAAAVDQELLLPQVEGLQTFDSSHLDDPSSELWSQAFLELAAPRIRQCLQAQAGSPAP